MHNFDELDSKGQRQRIEDEIISRRRGVDYAKAHNEMYETFFRIFEGLEKEYKEENDKKEITKINFIDKKNMLEEYYEIVKGNAHQVRQKHNNMIRKRSKERIIELQKQELEKRKQEEEQEEELERAKLLKKIENGQITEADNLNLMIHELTEYCV
ncbi:hypothetical protein [Clostridium botulinum]|uniref:hypothetical protein n=1 Tax=Clostridium botulinum TaxID=1491 RepID=UPI003DA4AB3D